MPHVEVGVSLFSLCIQGILLTGRLAALSRTPDLLGAGVDRMRPGIGCLDLETLGETLVQLELQPMVVGIGSSTTLDAGVKAGVQPGATKEAPPSFWAGPSRWNTSAKNKRTVDAEKAS